MAEINLEQYSSAELEQLKKDIDKELNQRRKQEEKQARQELKEVAKKYGFSLDELIAARGGKASGGGGKRPPQYQHPHDPNKTWTGRGRRPHWVNDWIENGGSWEEIEIKQGAA